MSCVEGLIKEGGLMVNSLNAPLLSFFECITQMFFLQYFTVLNFEKIVHRFIDDDNEFKNYNIV